MVADEHRYGLMPVGRKCWTLRGVRHTAPYQTKYERGRFYSASGVDGTHAAKVLCPSTVNLATDRLLDSSSESLECGCRFNRTN